jgi:hypothetical protein
VIAHLPDGHRVRWLSGKPTDAFLEVETSLNGAHLRGFASSKYLVKIAEAGDIPVVVPRATPPLTGAIAVSAPRKDVARDPAHRNRECAVAERAQPARARRHHAAGTSDEPVAHRGLSRRRQGVARALPATRRHDLLQHLRA